MPESRRKRNQTPDLTVDASLLQPAARAGVWDDVRMASQVSIRSNRLFEKHLACDPKDWIWRSSTTAARWHQPSPCGLSVCRTLVGLSTLSHPCRTLAPRYAARSTLSESRHMYLRPHRLVRGERGSALSSARQTAPQGRLPPPYQCDTRITRRFYPPAAGFVHVVLVSAVAFEQM